MAMVLAELPKTGMVVKAVMPLWSASFLRGWGVVDARRFWVMKGFSGGDVVGSTEGRSWRAAMKSAGRDGATMRFLFGCSGVRVEMEHHVAAGYWLSMMSEMRLRIWCRGLPAMIASRMAM